MGFDIGFIKAQTHTPEYLMHKYWARKPHNVISECIAALTSENDVVLDPFCGSGVALREGALLGRNCYGFDLNPAAVLISRVLLDPPGPEEFTAVFEGIYDSAYARFGQLFQTGDGQTIKYLSHRIIARCGCGEAVSQASCQRDGKKLLCPRCGRAVRFNLETLADTEIFRITVENDKNYAAPAAELARQEALSRCTDGSADTASYDFAFPENRRILAFKGIRTSSFFTKRNFCILSFFADRIWEIENTKIRDCALLLLTASAAQCSRLIASRNNLSTGGPAWSIPGFWVPQEHLEANPFVHVRARLSKYKKALERLQETPARGKAEVYLGNSLELLRSGSFSGLKADLIFLDPPYGDSVPYTEFSNIWNSFLKKIPSSDDDISVSDRIDKTQSWQNYADKLSQYMACFAAHLTDGGKLLITFNNNDMRAWTALVSALQTNGFVCRSVFYQIPAVISSKAQMSLQSSYISDVYSVYTFAPEEVPSSDLSPLLSHLCFVANSRGGQVSRTVLDREFIISWLKNNIHYRLAEEKEAIIGSILDFDKSSGVYTIKAGYRKETPLLKDAVKEAVDKALRAGINTLTDCYLAACTECAQYGTMELAEFRSYISEYAVEKGKIFGYTQLDLF
ncbi:MAG: DNA methyltransferase [Oscillospiraceae bacterium]